MQAVAARPGPRRPAAAGDGGGAAARRSMSGEVGPGEEVVWFALSFPRSDQTLEGVMIRKNWKPYVKENRFTEIA